eukprot:838978-Lingulodinium_polyedra.AAC.1
MRAPRKTMRLTCGNSYMSMSMSTYKSSTRSTTTATTEPYHHGADKTASAYGKNDSNTVNNINA